MQLYLFQYRVRVSKSQRHTPSQEFPQYPPGLFSESEKSLETLLFATIRTTMDKTASSELINSFKISFDCKIFTAQDQRLRLRNLQEQHALLFFSFSSHMTSLVLYFQFSTSLANNSYKTHSPHLFFFFYNFGQRNILIYLHYLK